MTQGLICCQDWLVGRGRSSLLTSVEDDLSALEKVVLGTISISFNLVFYYISLTFQIYC